MRESEAAEGEHAPLLRPEDQISNHSAYRGAASEQSPPKSNTPFYLALVLIFLVQAGLAAAVAPTTSVLEGLICTRYYCASQREVTISTLEHGQDCKAEPI